MAERKADIINTKYVDVLDGIRVLAVFTVAHFHIWQQSWWTLNIKNSFLTKLGLEGIMLEPYQRYGSFFVDLMILLTGFCLFLPYARTMIEDKKEIAPPGGKDTLNFYKKRIARIVPSYYFCTLIYLIFIILPDKKYGSVGAFFSDSSMVKQLIANLTFTQIWNPDTYVSSPFNGALWTVAVEMQFYLIFPVLAWLFSKKPVITFAGLTGISYIYIQFYLMKMEDGDFRWHMNQMPALLCVFALGMMGSLLFVSLANSLERSGLVPAFFTFVSIASLLGVRAILKGGRGNLEQNHWQVRIRFEMAVLFMAFVVSTSLASRWYRKIFGNKLAHFLAGISYNFYIWHQVIAVKLKEYKIPYWEGETLPNVAGNTSWMKKYTLIVVVAVLAFSTLVTYLIEKPLAKKLSK